MGDWYLLPSWRRLQARFKEIVPEDVACLYTAAPSDSSEGCLHQTLLQYVSFQAFPSLSREQAEEMHKVVEATIGFHRRAIWLTYRGLTWTPTGLCLQGFPQDSHDYYRVMRLREDIENQLKAKGLPYAIPYKNDIFHATFMRWKKQPSPELVAQLVEEVKRWSECVFGDLRIRSWTLGQATWTMLPTERLDLYNVSLYRHICHRGNFWGKGTDEENSPETLDKRDAEKQDVECDVWYKDGQLWLGHDKPEHRTTWAWLLETPRRLIHAKDGPTFEHLIHEVGIHGYDLHFFYHTNEDYALTNKGLVIVCPGRDLLKGSLHMMPEMELIEIEQREQLFAICSDRVDAYWKHWDETSCVKWKRIT
jgi:hypothetical protein